MADAEQQIDATDRARSAVQAVLDVAPNSSAPSTPCGS
jgi:hypothetical protein